jgi:hypothetical protein
MFHTGASALYPRYTWRIRKELLMGMKVRESRRPDARSININRKFGKTLEELVGEYGESVVARFCVLGLKSNLRSKVRKELVAGRSDEEIHAAVEGWIPPTKTVSKQVLRLAEQLKRCSKEDLAKLNQMITLSEQAAN